MRKQSRPNQSARKQMQNLTVELFAWDKDARRRQLNDEALAATLAATAPRTATRPTPPAQSSKPSPAQVDDTKSEIIPELVQILLGTDENRPPLAKPESSSKSEKKPEPEPNAQSEPNEPEPEPEPIGEPEPVTLSSSSESESDPVSEASSEDVNVADEIEDVEGGGEEDVTIDPTCAELIAEEERQLAEMEAATAITESIDNETTPSPPPPPPPPIRRVPIDVAEKHALLANIRAVTDSLNISAHQMTSSSSSLPPLPPLPPQPPFASSSPFVLTSSPPNTNSYHHPNHPLHPHYQQLQLQQQQQQQQQLQMLQNVGGPPPPSTLLASSSPLAQHHHQQQQQPTATPSSTEPMSFAACVRKMPSVESISLAPSPYKFDGKSNPFNNPNTFGGTHGPAGGGHTNPFGGGGVGGGGFVSPFANRSANPFANRRPFEYDGRLPRHTVGPSDRFDGGGGHSTSTTDAFSSHHHHHHRSGATTNNTFRGASSGPSTWRSARGSFSSASSFYPSAAAGAASGVSTGATGAPLLNCGGFSRATLTPPPPPPPPHHHPHTMNIPSHGHVEDLDGFLAASAASAISMTTATPMTTPMTTNPWTTTMSSSSLTSRRPDLLNQKKERWARMKAKKRLLRRPVDEPDLWEEDADLDEEILRGQGVMLNQIVQQNPSGHYEDADLLRKFRRDVAYVKEHVLREVDGNLDAIRELRFLLASCQTYGNIDGECMMAELAMAEFSLFSGIVEKFHAIVGPWQTDNESQRRRASRHAFETHRIPLQHSLATVSKRKLIEEILGRVEPSIACHQGVRVGLYSETCDAKTRVELNIKNQFKDAGMICDKNQRRFVLVLQSELELMVESMKHLANTVGLNYDGFPTHHNRFVIVEAFVEAIAEIMNEKVDVETMRWFSLLGQKIDASDNASPWETGADFYCFRHSEPKCNFCAQVTVGRTCCIIYHVIGTFFRRYHLRKIPMSAQTAPSTTMAMAMARTSSATSSAPMTSSKADTNSNNNPTSFIYSSPTMAP